VIEREKSIENSYLYPKFNPLFINPSIQFQFQILICSIFFLPIFELIVGAGDQGMAGQQQHILKEGKVPNWKTK
jgi:hypothetical protein